MEDTPMQEPAPWLTDVQRWLKMRPRQVQGCCFLASESLAAAHPELRVVHGAAGNRPLEYWLSGRVFTRGDTFTSHAWCVAPDGSIVDPTAHQYGRKRKIWRYPLRNGWRWASVDEGRLCPRCRARRIVGHDVPPCCGFGQYKWIAHIIEQSGVPQ